MSDMTDEDLSERGCVGCGKNYNMNQYIYCTNCMYGRPSKLDEEDQKRMKKIIKEREARMDRQ